MSEPHSKDDENIEELVGQLADEFAERRERGEQPSVEEYAVRYPEIADMLRRLLPTLQAMCALSDDSASSDDSAAETADLSGRLGDYSIIRPIGRGGMGVVYEAEQLSIGRRVALKVLPFAAMLDPKQLQRFKNEVHAAGQLHHNNIVPVYSVGCERGLHYYAMQFIEGRTLAEVIAELRLLDRKTSRNLRVPPASSRSTPTLAANGQQGEARRLPITPREPTSFAAATPPVASLSTEYSSSSSAFYRAAARLGIQAAEALEHAHEHGVIHRDIKPSNLLLDTRGHLWVTDFGLARVEANPALTMTGDILGTLRYMSPEQAAGNQVVDHRTDIYSLGITLYELLTLQPAFTQNDRRELLCQITSQDPPPPRKVNKAIPLELETIVLKAIGKLPGERYGKAQELADDLERYLGDKPIRARRPSLAQRLVKWSRRHTAAVATAAAALGLILLAGIAGLAISSSLISRERDKIRDERDIAQRRLYDARLAQARAGRRSGQLGQRFESLRAISEAAKLARTLKLNQSAWMELRNEAIACLGLYDVQHVGEWELPSNEWLALDSNHTHFATRDPAGHIRVRRAVDNQEVASLAPPVNNAFRVAGFAGFSANGDLLPLYDSSSAIYVWDWRTSSMVFRSPVTDGIPHANCFSPDSKLVAIGRRNGSVTVFDLASGAELLQLDTKCEPHDVAFSPDGAKLAVASYAGREVQVWDLATQKLARKFEDPFGAWHVAWHPEGRLLASSSNDYYVHLWDVQTGEEHSILRGHQTVPHAVQFNRDGDLLCSWAWDGTVRLWNPDSGQELLRLPGIDGWLSANGRTVACRRGGKLQTWQLSRGDAYRSLPTHSEWTRISSSYLNLAGVSPDGRWLAVSARTEGVGHVGLYDLVQHKPLAALPRAEGVLFHPSGHELFVSGTTGVYRWPLELKSGEFRIGPPEKLGVTHLGSLAVDATGRFLVYAALNRAEVLELNRPDIPVRQLPHAGCAQVAISHDSRWIATSPRPHYGGGVNVWESASGALVKPLLPDRSASIHFSPDNRWLLTCNYEAIRFWEVGSWEMRREIRMPGELNALVSWSPDSKLLAYTPSQYEIALEDASTGRTLAQLEAPDRYQAQGLAFTADGSGLAVWSSKPTHVRIWDLRLLRSQLQELGLDWDTPPFPPVDANPERGAPVRVEVDVGYLPYAERGRAHAAQSKWDQAIAEYSSGIEQQVNAWPLWELRAQAHSALGLLDNAAADYSKLLKLRPFDASYLARRANVFARAGNWYKALADHAALVELDPANAASKNNLAWHLATCPDSALRDPPRALRLSQEAIEISPGSDYIWNTLGVAYYRAGEWRHAIEALKKSDELYRQQFFSFNGFFLAMAHWQLGEYDEARLWHQRSVEWMAVHLPDDPELIRFRAEAEQLLGATPN